MTDRDAPRSDSPADPPQWGQRPAGGWGAPTDADRPRTEEPTQVWPEGWPSSPAAGEEAATARHVPGSDEQTVLHGGPGSAADDRTVAHDPRSAAAPPGDDRTVAWSPPPGREDDRDDRTVAAPPPAAAGEDRTVAWSPPGREDDRDDRTVAAPPPAAGEDRTVAWPGPSGGLQAAAASPAAPPGWAAAPPWPGPDGRPAPPPDVDRTQQADPSPFRPAEPYQQGWAPPPPPQQSWGPPPQQSWGPPQQQQWAPAWNGPGAPPPPLPDGPTRPRGRSRLPWILGIVALLVVVVGIVLAFVAPGYLVTRVFDRVAVQKGVAQILTDSYQISGVTGVTCPDGVKVQQGGTFTCDATIDGATKQVPVRITSNSGDYEVQRPQ